MRHLRALCLDRRVWTDAIRFLPLVERIVNTTPHSSIGTYPLRVLFGDNLQLNRGLLVPYQPNDVLSMEDVIQDLNSQLKAIVDASLAHQRQVNNYWAEKDPPVDTFFNEGDYVLVKYPNIPPNKLLRWEGPKIVVERRGKIYDCQDLVTMQIQPHHVTRLKYYDASRDENPLLTAAHDTDSFPIVEVLAISLRREDDHTQPQVPHTRPSQCKPRRDLLVHARFVSGEEHWIAWAFARQTAALDTFLRTHNGYSHLR